MAYLNYASSIVGFDDSTSSNNPQRKNPDWRRSIQNIPLTKVPMGLQVSLEPFEEQENFDGVRTTGIDGTTQFTLASILDGSHYRLSWTGTGTNPAFRAARTVSITGALTIVVNSNQTITVSHADGAIFGNVVVGDVMMIPGATTGDTSLFDTLNEGEWLVIGKTSSILTLTRQPGETFSGLSETKTVVASSQCQFFSSSGVQVGDVVDILGSFSYSTCRSFDITRVIPGAIEFLSTLPVAPETVIPTLGNVKIYSSAKMFAHIESDQEIAIKFNNSTEESVRVEPFFPGNPERVGIFTKYGVVYSLSVKNRTAVQANIVLILAE